ncbi:EthD family reductase [Bordetella muralis]|uniref:EthD family reductase n=1 Tax=Bordetella muralis TaxID=1649130 RepID=UPI0039F137F1
MTKIMANNERENMTKMIVVCAGDANTRFDRDYYANAHFALARACWEQYGLQSVEAFFPYAEAGDWKSIGIYTFSSVQGMHDALQSPATQRVMDDVKNFTDAPVVVRSLFKELGP